MNVRRLPSETLEVMRKSYRSVSEHLLQTRTPKGPSADEVKRMHQQSLLLLSGYKKEENGKFEKEKQF